MIDFLYVILPKFTSYVSFFGFCSEISSFNTVKNQEREGGRLGDQSVLYKMGKKIPR
jgi:hypothetical protein